MVRNPRIESTAVSQIESVCLSLQNARERGDDYRIKILCTELVNILNEYAAKVTRDK
jgi:hypothetical protein